MKRKLLKQLENGESVENIKAGLKAIERKNLDINDTNSINTEMHIYDSQSLLEI